MKNITRYVNVVLSVATFLICSLPTASNAEMIIIYATEDSGMLDEDDRNDPFPGIIYSELDTTTPGDIWLSILKFDLSPLAGKTISSATFELTSNFNHTNGFFNHEVFSSSDDSWAEETVTGLNRPLDSSLTLLDSAEINSVSQTYSWDVKTGVIETDGLGGANKFLTLLVRPELSQAGSAFGPHFNDRNSTTGVPRLVIDASSSECSPLGAVSPELDIHIPFISYQSLNGTQNLWVDLENSGTNSDGEQIWSLENYGFNTSDCTTIGTVSQNLDIYIPSINYESPTGTYELRVELKYSGTDSEGKHIWSLEDYGVNQ